MQEEYSGAIYIIGPDNKKYYEQGSNFLKAKFNKVIVIGDGEIDILDMNNEGPLQNLKTLNQNYPELSEGKILVYINAHGMAEENVHYVQVNKGGNHLTSKKLFEALAENIKEPIDIIFVPCNGKVALTDIDVLPEMSRVLIFSEPDLSTFSTNIDVALKAISNDKFSLDNFYNNYLTRVLSMDESPAMFTVGGEAMDPITLSETYLGKPISETSRQYIHDNFGQSVCKNDTSCHDKIDNLMAKIEQSSSIDEFMVTAGENYLRALIEFHQMEQDHALSRNTHHDEAVIYNHKKSEHCYIEALDLKNKIDQLFLERGIGLKLDLSHPSWHEIDYHYSGYEALSYFMKHSDAGVYNTLLEDGFTENNNFPKPEYGEYGYVLGVIKDIHLSLSLAGDSEPV